MKRDEIAKKVGKHFSRLKKISKKIRLHGDDEAIHDFRVRIKKLRALLRLLAFTNHTGKKLRLSRRFKRLYHQLGQARNLLLVGEIICEYALSDPGLLPENYLQLIRKEILDKKLALAVVRFSKIIRYEHKRLLARIPRSLGNAPKKFLHNRSKTLREIASRNDISSEQFHKARKIFKDIAYNYKYLRPSQLRACLPIPKGKKAIKKLGSLLGNLQDIHATIAILNCWFTPEAAYRKDRLTIGQLLKRLRKEEKLQQACLAKLPAFNLARPVSSNSSQRDVQTCSC